MSSLRNIYYAFTTFARTKKRLTQHNIVIGNVELQGNVFGSKEAAYNIIVLYTYNIIYD